MELADKIKSIYNPMACKLEEFYRYTNPDGSIGGRVARSAKVHPSAIISWDAYVAPHAVVKENQIVGDGQMIVQNFSINFE